MTELSVSRWIYEDFRTYVFTHRNNLKSHHEKIFFTGENPLLLIEKMKQQPGKDIWICGGADLIWQLQQADLIDRYYISMIPTLLGNGVRLFQERDHAQKLSLIRTGSYNGIVELVYERR